MKRTLLVFAACAALFAAKAQTVSTFESLTLPTDSFWDGRYDIPAKGFASGNAFFTNKWDTSSSFHYWADGFAYSNKKDSSTAGFTNTYSAITAGGYSGSANYVIGKDDAIIRLSGAATGKEVEGVYVTNGTYAYKSMLTGDAFAKKFGGVTGNDSDYFFMSFIGWKGGVTKADTVKFYLADFRSANNSQDYIIKNWTWVNLSALGNVDSLQIMLTTSDVGAFGANTPFYYALDNFTTRDAGTAVQQVRDHVATLNAYPNPFAGELNLDNKSATELQVRVSDISGREIITQVVAAGASQKLSTSEWQKGIYFVHVISEGAATVTKVIKP